jgi:Cu-Zn family superoxide dismutase
MKKKVFTLLAALAFLPFSVISGTIPIHLVNQDGVGEVIGNVAVTEAKEGGLVFTPRIQHLSPGLHGFHIHQNPSCMAKIKNGHLVAGLSAGGHYDPHNIAAHGTPWGEGHLGDLPPLYVDANGHAMQSIHAPKLKMSDLKGRSIVIHANGDNHSDLPNKFGGGGARVACGVI